MTMLPIDPAELLPVSPERYRAIRCRLMTPPAAVQRVHAAARKAEARVFRRSFLQQRDVTAAEQRRRLISLFRVVECQDIDLRGLLKPRHIDSASVGQAGSIAEVVRMVGIAHGICPSELLRRTTNSRVPQLVIARQACFYEVAKAFPSLSIVTIAQALGGFDHSTLVHGIARHEERNGLPKLRPSLMRKYHGKP